MNILNVQISLGHYNHVGGGVRTLPTLRFVCSSLKNNTTFLLFIIKFFFRFVLHQKVKYTTQRPNSAFPSPPPSPPSCCVIASAFIVGIQYSSFASSWGSLSLVKDVAADFEISVRGLPRFFICVPACVELHHVHSLLLQPAHHLLLLGLGVLDQVEAEVVLYLDD